MADYLYRQLINQMNGAISCNIILIYADELGKGGLLFAGKRYSNLSYIFGFNRLIISDYRQIIFGMHTNNQPTIMTIALIKLTGI